MAVNAWGMKSVLCGVMLALGVCMVAIYACAAEDDTPMTTGDCLQIIEGYDHALGESKWPESATQDLEALLNDAAMACEAGAFERANTHIAAVKAEYERLSETPPEGITDADFWRMAMYMWGNKAHHKDVHFMRVKMNDDINTDIVGWYLNMDTPEGVFFDVVAVVKTLDGEVQRAAISIPYDSDNHVSLCHIESQPIETPTVTHEQWSEEEIKATFIMDMAPYALRVDDGMCDAPRIFWPQGQTPADEYDVMDLIVFRN